MLRIDRRVIPLLFIGLLSCATTKTSLVQGDYKIHTQDVIHFWEAYDSLRTNLDTTGIFQRLVLDRASGPFKHFIKKGKITAKNYTAQIRRYPAFYQSIRENSLDLIKRENEIRSTIKKLHEIYPGFHPADICIAFGNFFSGGTVYVEGNTKLVYIGLEYHSLDSSVIVSEFNSSMKDYLSRSNFLRTIIHELIHIQQETHGKAVKRAYFGDKLVHSVLREGVPDFIANLVYPSGNDGRYIEYGMQHEEKLKEKLKNELWLSDRSDWLYNTRTSAGQPADLGYFMGARIAGAYYERHKDQKDVITHIIEIKDVEQFVRESGYFR